ncbi:hypothetical protein PARA125_001580 [Parachlamydia sp. AcF125]|nr:hypothetical protein [Parachlamydia sp. AcF125]
MRASYRTDLSDAEWNLIKHLVEKPRVGFQENTLEKKYSMRFFILHGLDASGEIYLTIFLLGRLYTATFGIEKRQASLSKLIQPSVSNCG